MDRFEDWCVSLEMVGKSEQGPSSGKSGTIIHDMTGLRSMHRGISTALSRIFYKLSHDKFRDSRTSLDG